MGYILNLTIDDDVVVRGGKTFPVKVLKQFSDEGFQLVMAVLDMEGAHIGVGHNPVADTDYIADYRGELDTEDFIRSLQEQGFNVLQNDTMASYLERNFG